MTRTSENDTADAGKRAAGRRTRVLGIGAIVTAALVLPTGIGGCSRGTESWQEQQSSVRTMTGVRETIDLFAGIAQNGIELGQPNAPVTLTEFADLQCSHCATFSLQVLPVIVRNYVRTGKVKIVFRNLAFLGEGSVEAARMAAAVGQQNQLWQFTHLFFHNQERTRSSDVTDKFLQNLARSLPGVDVDKAMSQRKSAAVDQQLNEANEMADRFEIPGTPAFLLGKTGQTPRVLDLPSLTPEALTKAIDAVLPPR